LWHRELLPYLPDAQFKGQLRELVAIMHDWRDKGKTNHLLINRVMEYDKKHLTSYFISYSQQYRRRYHKEIDRGIVWEFLEFANYKNDVDYEYSITNNKITSIKVLRGIFDGWHTKEYLRSNMANLWEKHFMGIGKSRITDEEWARLCKGYEQITGEKYQI
jgi:uncharacterized protein (TIGR02328 family)